MTEIFHSSVAVAAAGNSNPVIVKRLSQCTVTVIPGAGATAACQYTTSSDAEVAAGTANWINWPAGQVSSPSSDAILYRVTALRLSATGAAKLEVLGNE